MKWLWKLLARWPTAGALKLACVVGLVALATMVWGVLFPSPIPVVMSMSLSPVFGGAAFLLFGLSIAADVAQSRTGPAGGSPRAP